MVHEDQTHCCLLDSRLSTMQTLGSCTVRSLSGIALQNIRKSIKRDKCVETYKKEIAKNKTGKCLSKEKEKWLPL